MKKNIFSFMAISMLCMFNANATETSCFWKSKTPWQKMLTVLDKHGVDTTGMNVASIVSCDVLHEAADDLAKVFGVKEEMSWTTYYAKDIMVGDAICEYMKVKYARRNGEKYEYYKIMYSTDEDDFVRFASLYPNSKYRRDCGDKEWCLRAYWEWILNCRTEANCSTAFEYSRHGDECRQEGYVTMAYAVMEYMDTYDDWQLLMDTREKNGYDDCEAFVRFKEEHAEYLSAYAYFINDSIYQCRHRNVWNAATETNTIAAYQYYLDQYPSGEYAVKVKNKLKDYRCWMDAREKDSYVAYEYYCNTYPSGDSVSVANAAMKRIKDAEWSRVKGSKNWKMLRDFKAKYGEYYEDERDLVTLAMAEIEKNDWNRAKRINTWKSLSDFQDKYPYGFYYNEADEMKYKILEKNQSADISTADFKAIGFCSSPDSCVVMIGNVSGSKRQYRITLSSIDGKQKQYEVIRMGEVAIFRVPNGQYKVMIECFGVEGYYGDITVRGKVYFATYSITETNIFGKETTDFSDGAWGKVESLIENIRDREEERYYKNEQNRRDNRAFNAWGL